MRADIKFCAFHISSVLRVDGSFSGKTARRIRRSDYDDFDLLIGMDRANLRNMHRLFVEDPEDKIHALMEYTDRPGDVADPWYTRDFEATWRDVQEGCAGLLKWLEAGK